MKDKKDRKADLVTLKVTFSQNSLRVRTTRPEAERVLREVRTTDESRWLSMATERDGEAHLKRSEVIAVEIEPYQGISGKKEGVTLREICKVAGWSYSTWVKKVNRTDGLMLDMVSDRKIRCSDQNFDLLKLPESARELLRTLEKQRLSK